MSEREGTPQDFARLFGAAPAERQQDRHAFVSSLVEPYQPDPGPDAKDDPGKAHGAFIADVFQRSATRKAAQTAALTGTDVQVEALPDPPLSFDGGAREIAPGPSDPEADHNALLVELFRHSTGNGTGGGLW